MELVVALACASILSMVALHVYGSFQRATFSLLCSYREESGKWMHEVFEVQKKARGLGELPKNRF